MEAITILIGAGVCVFLVWFLESIFKDNSADETVRTERTDR